MAEAKLRVMEAKRPVVEAKPPVVEAKRPVVEAKPPTVGAKPPVVAAKPPVVAAKPPVVETKPPVIEAKPPTVEAKPPKVEAKPPVVEAKPPTVEAKPPAVEAKPPTVEAKPPVVEAKPPTVEAKPPVVEAKPPVVEAKPPTVEAKPPVPEAKPPVVEAKPPAAVEAKPPAVEAKPPVPETEPPIVEAKEALAQRTVFTLAEDFDGKPAARFAEDHADAEKSTPESKKKQKQYFMAIAGVLLIGGIAALQLDKKEVLNQVQQLQAYASKSNIGQSVLSKYRQLTQSGPFISGAESKEASHTAHHLAQNEASPATYEVSKPLVQDLTTYDEYVCQIRAIQHIEIRSLEKGYLQNVLIDEGQTVKQGQLLFQIKPNVYEADVEKSEAEVQLSQIELENNQALVAKDIISPTEAAMSAAKLNKVKAELELAKTHLGFTEIRAPFDGLIGRFGDIRLGSLLEENQLLTTLSDNHRLWVYFNVPEAIYLDYIQHIQKGASQKVKLELANKEIYPEPGTIEVIQSDFSSTSGNIAFRASFSNPKAILRYGQTGKILWPKTINHAIIVPQKSTFEILDKRFIFVVDKSGVIHERAIKVCSEQPNVYIIESGIGPDEMFLLERQNKLNKGDKIRFKLIDPQRAIESLKLYAE
ncbi:MAG: efflux RND transporter periplasmic adaptor subunit [Candidatus Obscuribacter sp.]|nr:efflux RND transporter periplasmic adaptor subunit [Candidatus Obscuribacter sp.]